MPIELSALDWTVFGIAVSVIMAYHGWFFITTTIVPDRQADAANTHRTEAELKDALRTGAAIDLDDYRRARQVRDAPPQTDQER